MALQQFIKGLHCGLKDLIIGQKHLIFNWYMGLRGENNTQLPVYFVGTPCKIWLVNEWYFDMFGVYIQIFN